MKLHIITPLYRFNLLEQVYNSIPMNDDITWHISKSNKREELDYDFLKKDNRVRLYNVDCEDEEAFKKRQYVLEKIDSGYFCFLDDDTIFHKNMYIKYLECTENNFRGMIVGEQTNTNGKLRLIASFPVYGKIDTGNVVSHYKCLEVCKWPSYHQPRINQKDFLFWDSVYNYYDKKCGIWNQPISFYNKLK